ncbi:MAG: enoyl-CoA hydratase [Chloroflexota bacterium]
MTDHILTSQEGAILRIQINRPDKKNALKSTMYRALADALVLADSERSIRVVFITGTDDSFTSGNDLMDFVNARPADEASPVIDFLQAISTLETPVVAAVNGVAVGVGTTMLLHCDLVYAAADARFQLPFVNLALVPEAASSYLLPQQIGYQRAAELLLLGDMFDADKAKEAGFVNEIVAPESLQVYAWEKAEALAQKAPEALRLTKKLLKQGNAHIVAETIQAELEVFRERLQSPEAMEVMQAFMARRPPDFSKL